MGFTVKHIIDTDVDGHWRLFFDLELARAMHREYPDLGTFEIIEERIENGLEHRRIECRPNVELPDFVKKLVGDSSYFEVGCFDTVQKKYSAYCVPKRGAEMFKSSYEVTARPIEDGKRCERVTVIQNSVKLFGFGAMAERMLERTHREAHDLSASFINKWLRSQH